MTDEQQAAMIIVCSGCGEMSDSEFCLWCAEEQMYEEQQAS